MPGEIARRMPEYDLDVYWAHNTYLELVVEHGLLGLILYLFTVIGLFRLARTPAAKTQSPDSPLRSVWPIVLSVYVFNALFVVMNYQFVNALVFTMAGILAADNRRNAERELLNS
jgi:O-antigen ligase